MTSEPENYIPRKLWVHSNPKSTAIYEFKRQAEVAAGQPFHVSLLLCKIELFSG